MNRRWPVGYQINIGPFQLRVIKGQKVRGNSHLYGDHVLQIKENGHWRHVPDELLFAIFDFQYENEEVLYPREHGKKGGNKVRDECMRAARHGYKSAQTWLEYEQGNLLD